MILCDSNVWLALALSRHSHHTAARDWLETVEETASVVFCRATQQTFLRLLTNASVLGPFGNPPLTNRQAWSAYDVVAQLKHIAPLLGFSGYQPLIRAYIGQGLRQDLERLERNPGLERLVENLRRHGVAEEIISSAVAESKSA